MRHYLGHCLVFLGRRSLTWPADICSSSLMLCLTQSVSVRRDGTNFGLSIWFFPATPLRNVLSLCPLNKDLSPPSNFDPDFPALLRNSFVVDPLLALPALVCFCEGETILSCGPPLLFPSSHLTIRFSNSCCPPRLSLLFYHFRFRGFGISLLFFSSYDMPRARACRGMVTIPAWTYGSFGIAFAHVRATALALADASICTLAGRQASSLNTPFLCTRSADIS